MNGSVIGFDHQPRTRIVFGPNCLDQLGDCARSLTQGRAMVVTDEHIVAAGHVKRAEESLQSAGFDVTVFDHVRENPTTGDVDRCLQVARACKPDLFVGLGGGSSLDTAKGCNFLLTGGGCMQDYWGVGKATKPMLPMIAIPTTAGTGSECQSYALIADEKTHQKMACGDPKAAPAIAMLDPVLTLTQPRDVTVCTGIDALTHALETAVTTRRNPLSQMYSREAFGLINQSLSQVLDDGENLDARGALLLGAALAGTAIENSMLGAAHSAANPLTAHYGIVHGQAVGLMLPHVMRYNTADQRACDIYAELAKSNGHVPRGDSLDVAEALIDTVCKILAHAGLATNLADCGVREADIPMLAGEAAGQWTAQFNPRSIAAGDFETLYQRAYSSS